MTVEVLVRVALVTVLAAACGGKDEPSGDDDDDTTPGDDDDDTTPGDDDDTAPGDDDDTPPDEVRAPIAAEAGGVVEAFGARLVIPAGALSADTEIVVRVADAAVLPSSASAGTALDFGPDGLAFLTPATLTLPLAGSPTGDEVAVISRVDAGEWVDLESTASATEVSAPIAHFTVYGPRWVPGPIGGNQVTVDGAAVTFTTATVGIPGNNSVTYSANDDSFVNLVSMYTLEAVGVRSCDGVTNLGIFLDGQQFDSRGPGGSCEIEILDLGGFGYPFLATYEGTLTDATGTEVRVLTRGSMEVAR